MTGGWSFLRAAKSQPSALVLREGRLARRFAVRLSSLLAIAN
ncbi:hypothetical protein T190_22760 [Sinorhizobium meliloti CCBAU 01290]|nr:hypothetical protein T190_22760 [Sinorhizobium meliloti CCBAU 01290]